MRRYKPKGAVVPGRKIPSGHKEVTGCVLGDDGQLLEVGSDEKSEIAFAWVDFTPTEIPEAGE